MSSLKCDPAKTLFLHVDMWILFLLYFYINARTRHSRVFHPDTFTQYYTPSLCCRSKDSGSAAPYCSQEPLSTCPPTYGCWQPPQVVFWCEAHWLRLSLWFSIFRLSTPNPRIQREKCSKVCHHASIQTVSGFGAFQTWFSNFFFLEHK